MAYSETDNVPPKKMTITTRMPKNQPHSRRVGLIDLEDPV
jgi:hypothetical protein